MTKRYWIIDITEGMEIVFRTKLAGNLSCQEIGAILQRLASRDLTRREVVAASIRKPMRTSLLEVRIDGPPDSKRMMVWLPTLPDFKASLWQAGELRDYSDI